jgi:ATP-dependent helicase/nuclease subunit A
MGVKAAPLGDQADRHAAVLEKQRNVLIDAGAGTGKTTILVGRIVELVAPADDAQAALSIDRVVAVTFTRRAAGELRLRAREEILRVLAGNPSPLRESRLRAALTGLDTAHVGTIHSFADRLLRSRPAEANISPSYQICEDTSVLVDDTTGALVRGAERLELATYLPAEPASVRARAAEAEETIRLYLQADLPLQEWVAHYNVQAGLDSVVAAFVDSRDQPPQDPPLLEPDLAAFRETAGRFAREADEMIGGSVGSDWLRKRAPQVRALLEEDDAADLLAKLRSLFGSLPDYTMGEHFEGDKPGWDLWNRLRRGIKPAKPRASAKVDGTGKAKAKGKSKADVTPTPTPVPVAVEMPSYLDTMRAPLERWLAHRMVRLFPVVVALYEAVKARAQAVDHLDLLLKLRDLLRDDPATRAGYQEMFDHILVDEFQDTDPLQAEVLLYLAAKPATNIAEVWTDAAPLPGKLTLVGDPKQSIYRFRRADIAAYDRIWQVIRRGNPLEVQLVANFRSRPELIDFANHRFEALLGKPPSPGQLFDTAAGEAFHNPLEAGRASEPADAGRAIHVLPLEPCEGGPSGADDFRKIEGQALATYLRWLKEKSGLRISDPLDRRRRPIEFGDIAVLAFSTFTLKYLFEPLDELGVPYSSRGGVLFLSDALHQQFLLGLRALADRKDGVAMASLLRPPFFAIDPLDLLLEQAANQSARAASGGEGVSTSQDPRVARAREARALVSELRRRRFDRSPGSTARELLERTGFGRMVALGPNGAQRLERLRELCLQIDRRAADEGLDFDAVTALTRGWVDHPVQLDAPHPVGTDAVQVLTVHQAKGLEWPVVVLWDGCAQLADRERPLVWKTDRGVRAWTFEVKGLDWEEPPEAGIKRREAAFETAQRKRLVYVAGTRARDLLVIAAPGKGAKTIAGRLLDGAPDQLIEKLPTWVDGQGAPWAAGIEAPTPPGVQQIDHKLEDGLATRWGEGVAISATPHLAPIAISRAAHAEADALAAAVLAGADDAAEFEEEVRAPRRVGRFGAVFGETVHQAIGTMLRGETVSTQAAVELAARATGLDHHLPEAAADVERAIEALRTLDVQAPIGQNIRVEYPLAGVGPGGSLLGGYADLVVARDGEIVVVDFKSDAPPTADVGVTHPEYVAQVRVYAQLIRIAQPRARMRGVLLFTADGLIRWVDVEQQTSGG